MSTLNCEWHRAAGPDVPYMVALARMNYEQEIADIWRPDTVAMARNLTHAVVDQFYNPKQSLITCAVDGGELAAFTWAVRGERVPWSDDEMVVVKMASMGLTLPRRLRLRLLEDMIIQWEIWARDIRVPIICSSTIRTDSQAFMRKHEQMGYQVRGNLAWKRLVEKAFIRVDDLPLV